MPRYDYRCPACGKTVERRHGFNEPPPVSYCDAAHQRVRLERIFAMPAVHLKGYGFHATDTRSSDEKYAFDHFDGSGTNAELKAMDRRIRDPESTVPDRKR
jgi:putative FmdB family regulatory protein